MLNRYQKAITNVTAKVIEDVGLRKYELNYKEDLQALRYLVSRSVALSPKVTYEEWGEVPVCPVCGYELDSAAGLDFCPKCGQRIGWEDE